MEVTTSFCFVSYSRQFKNVAGERTKFVVRAVRSGQNGACVVVCCVVLCCVVLCCVVLCCTVLCCAVLYCVVLCCVVL
jgi:hypothetical protein